MLGLPLMFANCTKAGFLGWTLLSVAVVAVGTSSYRCPSSENPLTPPPGQEWQLLPSEPQLTLYTGLQ